ncbi:MAG: nucleotidyl transferase AbiEii/AbiGii toxin family protein [Bacteroidia bacterium]
MNILSDAHRKLLEDLLTGKVTFLLVGGYAVNYHGYPRYTADLDIWLKPDNANKKSLLSLLEDYGFDAESIMRVQELNFSEAHSFHIGKNEARVDFMTKASGLQFHEAFQHHVILKLEDIEVPVIHFQDLIVNKLMSGRPQDRADVDMLQNIHKYRNKP